MGNRRMAGAFLGLLGLVLVAWPAQAADTPGFGLGLRGGAVLAQTDQTGKIGPGGAAFLRHGLTPRLALELSGGYSRMVTEDSLWWNKTLAPAARLAKESYTTDMGLAELRLLFTPWLREKWVPFVYAGGGMDFWKLVDLTPRRGTGGTKGSTGMVPLGLGLRRNLGERWAMEGSVGYTLVFSDNVDGLDEGRYAARFGDAGSKDNFLSATLGLVYQIPGGARQAAPSAVAAPVAAPKAPSDQDEAARRKAEQEAKDKAAAAARQAAEEARLRQAAAQKAVAFVPVYFDYDSYAIRDDQRPRLSQHVDQLKAHPGGMATLAGHCDERGTLEYNLALGHKRASSVKDYFVRAGIPADQLKTISYGKERPAVAGHDEAAWSQNRRVEIDLAP